jgi:hypothetical protein
MNGALFASGNEGNHMIRTIAAIAALAVAAPAFAQTTPSNGAVLSLSQIEQRLTSQGYRVLEIERDDGEFEVKALNAQGQCRELHLNLRTGEIRREEADDDCYSENRARPGGRR